jgi:hypothetical protein
MALSGVFPEPGGASVKVGELTIVLCGECKLAQLDRDFPGHEMYGDNYGYMSSLNNSMIDHLRSIVLELEKSAELAPGDLVLDIGSNDGTMLSLYGIPGLVRVGMDPTIVKYSALYPLDAIKVPEFFSAGAFKVACPGKRAKVITTIAMLYDLPDPSGFATEVREILADDGLWHIEVSYGPWMLESGAFDAVCHEHIEYYSLHTLKRILDAAGFKICSVSFNEVNGGSISLTATPLSNSKKREAIESVSSVISKENLDRYNEVAGWLSFGELARARIADVDEFIVRVKSSGRRIMALGASTKGNILLQSLSPIALGAIEAIGEVNDFKFGKVTPGTGIRIVPENEVIDSKPDFILVLPWHFRDSFDKLLEEFVSRGGSVLYPLPKLEVASAGSSSP